MVRYGARHLDQPGKLSPVDQARFDALYKTMGEGPLAIELGIGTTAVSRVVYGGAAKMDTIARIAARLREVDAA